MKSISLLILGLSASLSAAAVPPPGADGKYTISAPGIRAQFIPFAAAITNLFVLDKNGIERDIILGHDSPSNYSADPGTHMGAIPGRYANRIGNAQFTLDGVTYHTPQNDGSNTLHSGPNGWGNRTFEVVAVSDNSITFGIHDPAFSTGMPGSIDANVTYTLTEKTWKIKIHALSPEARTPLMLTQHTYWNLDAFANPETDLIWNHTYYTPYSKRLLAPDPNMVPTGEITTIPQGDINDFWSAPKQLGTNLLTPGWVGNCGTGSGCEGYNNCWLVDKSPRIAKPVATLSSDWSGIKMEIYTGQAAVQLYSCYWMPGTTPIKSTQGGEGAAGNGLIKSGGCVALEAQDWNDGINHPEWGRNQFYGPGDDYNWEATYKFGLL
ncbi:uncharacterized protein LAJ45_09666 [Morchella importuna]|uniref:uncharacterized protein n=1 Tax=Morchella importuna TaxID=1174673 RepID=UPI001E8D73F8|nr:uncharacterized protein LAJ45_09666 [Morchella importuna]KAH8146224.1 hypothetical protein LAJ45_09666 [Morchella importuna]